MLIAGLHATPAFLDQFHPACPSRLSPPTSTSQVAPATTPTPTPTRAPDSNVDLNLDSTPQKHHLRIKSTFRFSRCREVSNAIVLYCASEFTSFAISALALLQSAAHISPITSNFCVRLRLLTLQIGELLAWFLTVKVRNPLNIQSEALIKKKRRHYSTFPITPTRRFRTHFHITLKPAFDPVSVHCY